MHDLSLLAALNQLGVRQNFQVVRNRGRRYAAQFRKISATEVMFRGDGLKDAQPRFICERLRYVLNSVSIHYGTLTNSNLSADV
jgi:hypothetical protein